MTAEEEILGVVGDETAARAAADTTITGNLSTHANNTSIHTSATEKAVWNAKATEEDVQNALSEALSATEDVETALTSETNARKSSDVVGITLSDGKKITLTRSNATTLILTLALASSSVDGLLPKETYTLIQQLAGRVNSLEQQGVWRGTFDTYADLPSNISSEDWLHGEPGTDDYVNVRADENNGDAVARYLIIETDSDGDITYGFDMILGSVGESYSEAGTGILGLIQGVEDSGGGLEDPNFGLGYIESGGIVAPIGMNALRSALAEVSDFITGHAHTGNDGTEKIAYGNITGTPTLGNGTITIEQGGEVKGTFSVNQTGNTTITLDAG
jgi:hypothetical protein